MGKRVLVTGAASYLGAGVARTLAQRPDVERVVGIDVRSPAHPLGDAEFVRTDVRNPLVGRVLRRPEVDTVVHFGAAPTQGSASARTSAKEAAVIGTMHLVGVCQSLPSLRHVVLASTGSVYGSSASAPAVLTERAALNVRSRSGHVRDAIEVEAYVRALEQRRPDVGVTVLRLTHVFGEHTTSAMTEYLRAPVVPVPFGYDARLQALDEDDAVSAIVAAATGDPCGVVNVAGDGILTLRQVLRLAHRPSVPVWTTTGRALGTLSRWAGISTADADHFDYVMFGRCLDTTRMREVLGFAPQLTTREAVERFAAATWGVRPGGDVHATEAGRPARETATTEGDQP